MEDENENYRQRELNHMFLRVARIKGQVNQLLWQKAPFRCILESAQISHLASSLPLPLAMIHLDYYHLSALLL